MIKMSHIVAALLLGSVSIAHAQDPSGQPAQPATQGAASVQNNLDANKSNGKADKGLNTAETNITAKHRKTKHKKSDKSKGAAEKTEHAAKPDRPAMPERPAR